MISHLKSAVRKAANALGYRIERVPAAPHRLERDPAYADIIARAKPFTMTSCERMASLVDAARYVARNGIPGAIVECGVWRGGSMMAAALTLRESGGERDLYLFDTYAGMTAPTERDVDFRGRGAEERYRASITGNRSAWCYASLQDVTANLLSTGYSPERCHFIEGDVLETIPAQAPDQIAILRLDTDWYESTRHELTHLYPRLQPGGILIIDDYGYWRGCRQAVDEYFGRERPFLFSIDGTGCALVRPIESPAARDPGPPRRSGQQHHLRA